MQCREAAEEHFSACHLVAAHEVLLALYFEPSERWTVNAGLGTGIGSDALDLSVRTAVVLRLLK